MSIKTNDGIFQSYPNFNSLFFYSRLKVNDEYHLLYCMSERNINYMINEPIQSDRQWISVHTIWSNKNEIELSIQENDRCHFSSESEELKNWSQIATIENALDEELDAKYYAATSYYGLDNTLFLDFIPPIHGFVDYINNSSAHEEYAYYLSESSIFTFRLNGRYKENVIKYYFLDDYKFLLVSENGLEKMTGFYESKREGMILHIEEKNGFNEINTNILELTAYFNADTYYKQTTDVDLTIYIN